MADQNMMLPKSVRSLIEVWPVVVALFVLTVAGAQASAKITDHDAKLAHFDALATERTDRLARVETRLDAEQHQLDRIEQKLDVALGAVRK